MPTRTNSWMNSSAHQSSKGTLPPLLAAATPNSSVVDVTERMLCWPGGTSARNVGWDGEFRRLSKVGVVAPSRHADGRVLFAGSGRLGKLEQDGHPRTELSFVDVKRSKTSARISFCGSVEDQPHLAFIAARRLGELVANEVRDDGGEAVHAGVFLAGGKGRHEQHAAFCVWAIKHQAEHPKLMAEIVRCDIPIVDDRPITGQVLGEAPYGSRARRPRQGAVHECKHADRPKADDPRT